MLYFWCFDILGPCWSRRDCSSQGQPCLKIVNMGTSFSNADQPIQNLYPQTPLLLGSHTLGHCPPNHPRARSQATRDSPCAPEPLKWFKPASPKPAYPACLFLHRNHNKGSYPHLLPSLCLLTDPSASPGGPPWCGVPLPLGSGSVTNYLFNDQLFPHLLALSFLNYNRIYVLKQ